MVGFYRGLWIPLITISFVREWFPPSLVTAPIHGGPPGAASFTIYTKTKEDFRSRNLLTRHNLVDTSLVGGIRSVYVPART